MSVPVNYHDTSIVAGMYCWTFYYICTSILMHFAQKFVLGNSTSQF